MESSDGDENLQPMLIEKLRQLRIDTRRLNSTLVERLKPFQKSDGSFKTLPDSKDRSKELGADAAQDISVASTCTVLMAAIGAGKAAIGADKKDKLFDEDTIRDVFRKSVVNAKWASSGLRDGNAFTTAMLIRTAGFVVAARMMAAPEVHALKHAHFKRNEGVALKTLEEIVHFKANRGEKSFAVEGYPPKTTHAYWFVDGVLGMEVALEESTWRKIAVWASNEFHRQLIYVSAGNDALMDPPSLAMAACLISRIRRLCEGKPKLSKIYAVLPSTVEVEFGVEQVFSKQSDSGIWHRYFPLFHFPKGQGAADYCFSFEFLEAIFVEFGSFVLGNVERLDRIKQVLRWCDTHELVFTDSTGKYRGWNSGGEVRNLAAGKSESWATASVHMFLTQLERSINDLLDELVLKCFGFDRRAVIESPKRFEELINADLRFPDESPTTLKDVIQTEILETAKKVESEMLIRAGLPVPRSALLFGPPGTSKSRLARAVAEYLGWPLIVITPSEFLGKGLEQVHAEVNKLFLDLMDLRRAVVFFDEMDALAQTREGDHVDGDVQSSPNNDTRRSSGGGAGEPLDVTRQLLTTSMLPKLASLWDQKRVIFLMATNHKQHLDPAITRPNRFDLLLCVAPPSWTSKCSAKNLEKILTIPEPTQVESELLRLAPNGSDAARRLDVFTVAEVGIFLNHLQRRKSQSSVLSALQQFTDASEFGRIVDGWARTSITLRTSSPALAEFEKDRDESRRQYYPGEE
jgi:hypothetical protein